MPKQLVGARIEESQVEALGRIAKEMGINVSEVLRRMIDSKLQDTDLEIELEALYEIQLRISRRIAEKEAERIAEIKASAKPPDLVIVAGVDGVLQAMDRGEAIKRGLKFKERKTAKK